MLQLVAVGSIFLASKQLEVSHPSVQQLVAVAAHSFSAGDLLRVERILLDALEFNVTGPTPYAFLHLLTQVRVCMIRALRGRGQQGCCTCARACASLLQAAAERSPRACS